jgi:ribosomal protein S8
MTQQTDILSHLKRHGHITAIEALDEYRCFRLAAIILKLRGKGHNIITTFFTTSTKAHPARYIYAGKPG